MKTMKLRTNYILQIQFWQLLTAMSRTAGENVLQIS